MLSALSLGAVLLLRRPWAAGATVLCLAVGMAAAAAALTLFDVAVLRPLGFTHVDRLVVLWESDRARGVELSEVSLADFEDWSRQAPSAASMAAFGSSHWPGLARIGEQTVPITRRAVSRTFFATLGAAPAAGRDFVEHDLERSSPPPALLGHRFWRNSLGGRGDVIGSSLFVDGVEHRVVGVMPRGFSFPSAPDVWVSVERELQRAFEANEVSQEQQRRVGVLEVVARVGDGISRERLRDELTAVSRAIHLRADPAPGQWAVVDTPLVDVLVGGLGARLWIAFAMAIAVLLFACANAAGIRVAEISGRELELTTRLFLGAGRRRLAAQLAGESVPLIALATVLSLAIAAGLLAWTAAVPVVAESGMALDQHRGVTWGAIGVFAIVAWLLAGWLPAISGAARLATRTLASSARSVGAGGRSRAALVGVQVALAICLVSAAGSAWQGFERLSRLDVGFATENVTTIDVALPEWRYASAESARQVETKLLTALEQVPGVEAAAGTSLRPFRFGAIVDGLPVRREEDERTTAEAAIAASRVTATPNYFRALGIAIEEGREFTDDDRVDAEPVAVIGRSLARTLWGDVPSVGRRVQIYTLATKWQRRTIVGVADDARSRGLEKPALELYVPHAQASLRIGTFVVRAPSDRTPTEAMLRQALHRVEPEIGLERIQTTGDILDTVLAPARVLATTTGLLGSVGLALVALGVFGAAATALASAWAEVAVRQAVGATPLRAARAPLALLGQAIGAGLAAGALASPAAVGATAMTGIAAERAWMLPLLAGALIVTAAAALAVWAPLMRAARLPPAELLRQR